MRLSSACKGCTNKDELTCKGFLEEQSCYSNVPNQSVFALPVSEFMNKQKRSICSSQKDVGFLLWILGTEGALGETLTLRFWPQKSLSCFVNWCLWSLTFRADLQNTIHFSGSKALLVCDGRREPRTLIEAAWKPTRNLI